MSKFRSLNKPESLLNKHFDDIYFDVIDAIDEAQHIFIKNNKVVSRIKKMAETEPNHAFVIGETGFGAGRNLASLMDYLKRSGLNNITIEYNTVELYPITPEKMHSLLENFKDRIEEHIVILLEAYQTIDISKPGWHSVKIQQSFGSIKLNLWIGEALEMVKSLEKPCDVWFLDGHAPKKNPSMWRPELLMAIGEKTKTNGSCSSFTVSGAVRRALASAGFTIYKLPGRGGKKEVLLAVKDEKDLNSQD
jgi:tRNA U34 5-methylaminomethyl-2-thiouridine-forming methyltransferase MnmC